MQGFDSPTSTPTRRTGRRVGFLLGGVLGALFATGQPVQALLIKVSYPNMANVPAAAMAEINNVINLVDGSFINNATINLTVDFTTDCGLGCSSTNFQTYTYPAWRAAVIANSAANPQNPYQAAAVANPGVLPAADPIGNGNVEVLNADARALGGLAVPAGNDSALRFNCFAQAPPNATKCDNAKSIFEFTGVATPKLYDFQNTFEHELDEALGLGSDLTGIANNDPLPALFEPYDYFRYSSTPGMRSLTTDPNAAVYFSYDGKTDVDRFNQDNNAAATPPTDRNDWIWGNFGCPAATVEVQNAIGCQDQVAAYGFGSPEFIALETLGYDPIPEPGTLTLLGTSLFGLAALRRRRRA